MYEDEGMMMRPKPELIIDEAPLETETPKINLVVTKRKIEKRTKEEDRLADIKKRYSPTELQAEEAILAEMKEPLTTTPLPQENPFKKTEIITADQPAVEEQESNSSQRITLTRTQIATNLLRAQIEPTQERTVLQEKSLDDRLRALGITIQEKIGSGGLRDVYKVVETSTNEVYAFKTINPKQLRIAEMKNPETGVLLTESLREEIRVMDQMSQKGSTHFPKTTKDLTLSDANGTLTQYIPTSLEDKIGTLTPDEAIHYFFDVGEGLTELHEEGIILGDTKPSNIRINEQDTAIIVDLDVKYTNQERKGRQSLRQSIGITSITDAGIKGTPCYMAPEQWNPEIRKDERTDVYQLTSLLYEMLAGRRPEGAWKKLFTIDPQLESLDAVVEKGMAQDPDDRYKSIKELEQAVRKTREEQLYSRQQEEQTRYTSISELEQAVLETREKLPYSRQQEEKTITVKSVFENIKEDSQSGYKELKTLTKVLAHYWLGLTLAIPTMVRRTKESLTEDEKRKIDDNLSFGSEGNLFGTPISLLVSTMSYAAYAGRLFNPPEVISAREDFQLMLPFVATIAATNLLSGAYEYGRNVFRRIKNDH